MTTGLCSRCGAVLPAVAPEGGDSACTGCGLGFSTAPLLRASRADVATDWPARRAEIAAGMARRNRAAVDAWRGTAYALDDRWNGRRWIGGHGREGKNITTITLGYGEAMDETAPHVRVETRRGRHATAWSEASSLASSLHHATGVHNDAMRAAFSDPDWREVWDTTVITVDGEPVTFASLTAGAHRVAVAEIGDAVVSIETRHVALTDLRLVAIDDLEPYLLDDGLPDEM